MSHVQRYRVGVHQTLEDVLNYYSTVSWSAQPHDVHSTIITKQLRQLSAILAGTHQRLLDKCPTPPSVEDSLHVCLVVDAFMMFHRCLRALEQLREYILNDIRPPPLDLDKMGYAELIPKTQKIGLRARSCGARLIRHVYSLYDRLQLNGFRLVKLPDTLLSYYDEVREHAMIYATQS